MTSGNTNERDFNKALGELIREIRKDWANYVDSEKTGVIKGEPSLAPDILIAPDNINPVTVESAYEKTDVDLDAPLRLGKVVKKSNLPILTSIALEVPLKVKKMELNEITQWLRDGNTFRYAAFSKDKGSSTVERYPKGENNTGYIEGDIWGLIDFIELASTPDSSIDRVADEVTESIKTISEILDRNLENSEIETLRGVIGQTENDQATKVAACIWVNAMILHDRMAKAGFTIPGQSEPIKSSRLVKSTKELLDAWDEIMTVNHKSIFLPARKSLQVMDDMRKHDIVVNLILPSLTDSVKSVSGLRIGPVGDIGSQMFATLASDRVETAAFYTKVSPAELLAGIAVPMLPPKEYYRVADLASGTGTLLKAAYRAIIRKDLGKSGQSEHPKSRHKNYMEDYLYAADIQPLAASLTCAGLSGIYPDEIFLRSNVACAPVKGDSKKLRVGSLEMLESDSLGNLLEEIEGEYDNKTTFSINDNSLDLVIMNPPYFVPRKGKKAYNYMGLKDKERKYLTDREKKLFKMNSRVGGSLRAGQSLMFAGLADKKIKAGGVFAFVIQKTSASSGSWNEFRKHMVQYYDDLTVISCGSGSYSESTSIGELFICGVKRDMPVKSESPVFVVTLNETPKNFIEAHVIANRIRKLKAEGKTSGDIDIGDHNLGVFYTNDRSDGIPWTLTSSVEMNEITENLTNGNEIVFPGLVNRMPFHEMKPMANHSKLTIGSAPPTLGSKYGDKEVKGSFMFKKLNTVGSRTNLALYGVDSKFQRSVYCEPTHRGIPHEHVDPEDAKKLIDTDRSTVFISRLLGVGSQSLASAMTKEKCLGGGWTALVCDEKCGPAYWMWLNSIFGLITRWQRGNKNQDNRVMMQIFDIERFRCPDFTTDNKKYETIRETAKKFTDSIVNEELMACNRAWRDPVRKKIDRAVCDMMGINMSDDELQILREMWCSEPFISNKGTVKLLKKDGIVNDD